jgi:probable phosphoglycerate mutase
MEQRWPDALWIVRHGESAGNVARDAAYAAGLPVIDISERDVDVPLSAAGEAQSVALGRWFAARPEGERPCVVLVSPYLRARHTASIIESAGGLSQPCTHVVDERLREKEFGILDRLTHLGIAQRFPEQAEMRARLGKFYHRPPSPAQRGRHDQPASQRGGQARARGRAPGDRAVLALPAGKHG